MLRAKSLVPLSRQHQHALALCVRIDRAQPIAGEDLESWQAEITEQYRQEVKIHFAAEEVAVFPAAVKFGELVPLVEGLMTEHGELRELFNRAEARSLTPEALVRFVQTLADHIRKEERQLFERMQELMTAEEIENLGVRLEVELKDAAQSCMLPHRPEAGD
jgi:hemerythrin-like domain-containing protein